MSRNSMTSIMCLAMSAAFLLLALTSARAAQAPSGRAIGEITSVDLGSRVVIIKTDSGQFITLSLSVDARLLKVPAGDTSFSRASETTLAGLSVGDRVSARGFLNPDKTRLAAETVIVMLKDDIQKKQEQDKQAWARRSVGGIVRDLKPDTGEIVVEVYGPSGPAKIVVQTAGCKFRRYSPTSVKFVDAVPGAFSDLRLGDQLRALGDKDASGAGWTASEIVSGSFQTVGGVVTAIDPERSEIKMSILGKKDDAPIAVAITKDSSLKRLSPQVAMILAQRALAPRPGPQSTPAGRKPAGAPGQKPPGAAQPPAAAQLPDSQVIIDSLPAIHLSGLKPGDVVAVTSAGSSSRVTAIKLVAGVDLVINALNARGRQMVALSAGLPVGVFDYGISQP